MKKLVALVLALVMVLSVSAVFAEAKTEYNVTVLVWKFDDTYGSSVRQAMLKWAETVGDELGVKINLDLQDAGDDMAKQVEQCDQAIGKNPDFVIINLAEPAGGQTLVDKLTAANIPFLFYNIPPSDETYDSVVKDTGAFFVGTLPREAGDMQGEILYKLWEEDPTKIDLNGDGKVQFVADGLRPLQHRLTHRGAVRVVEFPDEYGDVVLSLRFRKHGGNAQHHYQCQYQGYEFLHGMFLLVILFIQGSPC